MMDYRAEIRLLCSMRLCTYTVHDARNLIALSKSQVLHSNSFIAIFGVIMLTDAQTDESTLMTDPLWAYNNV